jgi:hypothetical protein
VLLEGPLPLIRWDDGLSVESSAPSPMAAELAGTVCGDETTTRSVATGPAGVPM